MRRVWGWLLLGLFIGGTVGFIVAALLAASKRDEAIIQRWQKDVREFNDRNPPSG